MASITTTFVTATSAYLHARAQTTVPPEVIGYTSTFGVYSAWNCLTGTWYEVSGFGRCCPTTQGDCPVYTTCLEGSIVANNQFRNTCGGTFKQTECITGTVYKSIGDTSPNYYVGCWPSWTGGGWEATRTLPVTTTEDSATTSFTTPSPASTSTTFASSSSSSSSMAPGVLAAIIIGIVFGLTLAIACGCISSCLWTHKKARRAEKEMREAELQIAALKVVRTSSIPPMRPQSKLAELREIDEVAEVVGEYSPGGQNDFFVPGHWRRPSEADGREIRRPEAALFIQRTTSLSRPIEVEEPVEAGEANASRFANSDTSRSGSSSNSRRNQRQSSHVEGLERTSISEGDAHEITQPLNVYKTGQLHQKKNMANGEVEVTNAEQEEKEGDLGDGKAQATQQPKATSPYEHKQQQVEYAGASSLERTDDRQELNEEHDLVEVATVSSGKEAMS